MTRDRRLVLIRGDDADARIAAMLAKLPDDAVLWVSPSAPPRPFVWSRPHELGGRLGQAFDAVVLDARAGLDADALGQAHGLIHGGGALCCWLAAPDAESPALARLAAFPHTPADVGRRFIGYAQAVLGRYASSSTEPRGSEERATRGTSEQARVVRRLVELWSAAPPSRAALIADRGRGKSSALGLALHEAAADGRERIVTGPSEAAVVEVLRFAGDAARFVPLLELLATPSRCATIVVDEAAQLPVPLLEQLVAEHPDADLAFATTTHGYEGTGRGFSLRFLAWLERRARVERLELHEPIRWARDDTLERAVFEALLLDAEPAVVPDDPDVDRAELVRLDRDALIADLPRLRELFGLLVHAHYRTTPGDLQRLLDAPNLEVHAALLDGRVVAASLVAHEGGLPEALIDAAHSGRTRLRAQALPDVLVAHLGHPEAGSLRMRRSVRIAVHPQLRRRGLATRLVEHVHASAEPDLWGTLFGATAELVEFRRRLGYELVRVSASRGARTGEPSLMMLRPVSEPARELVRSLRVELARELEVQLALLAADDGLSLEPALVAALWAELPAAKPYSPAECRALARAYAFGPRTFESCATAIRGFLATVDLGPLPADLRAVVVGRALELRSWREVTSAAGHASPSQSMRAMRRAIRRLLGDEVGDQEGPRQPT